jgi:hypothetical protein
VSIVKFLAKVSIVFGFFRANIRAAFAPLSRCGEKAMQVLVDVQVASIY